MVALSKEFTLIENQRRASTRQRYRVHPQTKINLLPVEFWVDNENNVIDPETQSLGVSNWVTTVDLPQTSSFTETNPDPENFRISLVSLDSDATSIDAALKIKRNGSIINTTTYTLTEKYGNNFRSNFLRLVSDDDDDAASGDGVASDPHNQTLKVQLGDILNVSYTVAPNKILESEISVGRPKEENNNSEILKYDIRVVKLNIVAFRLPGTDNTDPNNLPRPAATRSEILNDIAKANERFCQVNIRFEVVNIDMGDPVPNLTQGLINGEPVAGYINEPGVPLPIGTDLNWDNGASYSLFPGGIHPEQAALSVFRDTDANTIELFYLEKPDQTTGFTSDHNAYSFMAVNYPDDPQIKNTIYAFKSRGTLTVAHEFMHILGNRINPAHDDNQYSLLYLPLNDAVDKTKRIAPFNGFSEPQTTIIRDNSEVLP